jgi:hypothetical protein
MGDGVCTCASQACPDTGGTKQHLPQGVRVGLNTYSQLKKNGVGVLTLYCLYASFLYYNTRILISLSEENGSTVSPIVAQPDTPPPRTGEHDFNKLAFALCQKVFFQLFWSCDFFFRRFLNNPTPFL